MGTYKIQRDTDLGGNLREVLHGHLQDLQAQIGSDQDVHRTVHQTRRTTKRIRALLRLIRDEIGYSDYYRENRFYRDLSRRLSRARDSYVLQASLESLTERHPGMLSKAERDHLERALAEQTEAALDRFFRKEGGFVRLTEELSRARTRIDLYCRARDDFKSLQPGLERTYARGRRAFKRLQKGYTMEEFHEYRKSAKYLLYQVELLQTAYPAILKAYRKSLDAHGDHLGDSRDYDRLEQYLSGPAGELSERTVTGILEKLTELRKGLSAKIFAQARLIYAEKPEAFTRRIGSYWKNRMEDNQYALNTFT